ncbi:MAG: bifunctional phosphopantothenoylcysteine decarboxylase/phosphopantothenate--cysteine ligase CoaBC [Acidimicrobiales bacterium]
MSPLSGRQVVLGVCGSVAAYKAVDVCRRLVEAGAYVVPVLTADAGRFIGETTLSALASTRVRTSLWVDDDPVPHTALGRSADVVLVAPATARLLGSYAAGIADDLLTATLLATRAPVVVAPAMHTEMWEHPATVANVAVLRSRSVWVVEPEDGPLARGDEGLGRLAGTATILAAVEAALAPTGPLAGLRVLVTAGGTREPLDPVRYIGNRSSGRQGWAIASEAAGRGGRVTLVTTVARPPAPGIETAIEVVNVETAAEMADAVLARSDGADVVVMAAAVADFRPKEPAGAKLRRDHGPPDVVLEPTFDIAAEVGRRRRRGQVLVGFALETGGGDAMRASARAKLAAKHLDLVVANDVSALEAETNQAVIVDAAGGCEQTPVVTKGDLAVVVLDRVCRHLAAERGPGGEMGGS